MKKTPAIFKMKIIEVLRPSQSCHKLLPLASAELPGLIVTSPRAVTLFSNRSHHFGCIVCEDEKAKSLGHDPVPECFPELPSHPAGCRKGEES